MLKIFLATIVLSICTLGFATDNTHYRINDYPTPRKDKDSLKTDTIFYARRMGNELKLVLIKTGDVEVLINDVQTITINKDGFTGFGTKNPQYRVDVCGTIRASEELIVETNEWCDYVFEDSYMLQDFAERMSSIKKNKHLPYIKNEADILDNGVSVSETLNGLLHNMEEMYLYIEQLEKRIKLLEEENANLKSE
jgi:hypothetical protein